MEIITRRNFGKFLIAGSLTGLAEIVSCKKGGGHKRKKPVPKLNIPPTATLSSAVFSEGDVYHDVLLEDTDGKVVSYTVVDNGKENIYQISPNNKINIPSIKQSLNQNHNTFKVIAVDDKGASNSSREEAYDIPSRSELFNYTSQELNLEQRLKNGEIFEYWQDINGIDYYFDDISIKLNHIIVKEQDTAPIFINLVGYENSLEQELKNRDFIRNYDSSLEHSLYILKVPMEKAKEIFQEFRNKSGI